MAIPDWIEKLGRTVFESPFEALEGTREAPEMAEVRLALLDAVKAKSHRVGGRKVFPYNLVRVRLYGVPDDQASLFDGPFFPRFLEQEICVALDNLTYRRPGDIKVEVATTATLPGENGKWVAVETELQTQSGAAVKAKKARLVVARGSANQAEVPLLKTRVNIGRGIEVYRTDGPSRRNDLAFDDTGDVNRTVSREHAHILYSKETGEYRLYNDRTYHDPNKLGTNCGLWLMRDGLSLAVHRNSRGTRLEPGDEIHLGRAILRFLVR